MLCISQLAVSVAKLAARSPASPLPTNNRFLRTTAWRRSSRSEPLLWMGIRPSRRNVRRASRWLGVVLGQPWPTCERVCLAIAEYIEGFCGPVCLHSILGYLNPNDFESRLSAKKWTPWSVRKGGVEGEKKLSATGLSQLLAGRSMLHGCRRRGARLEPRQARVVSRVRSETAGGLRGRVTTPGGVESIGLPQV